MEAIRIMSDKRPIVFLSHVHEDKLIAKQLHDWIEEQLTGVDVFTSSLAESLPPGSYWQENLKHALMTSRISLHIINSVSIERRWIYFEAGVAYGRQIPMVPLCIEGVTISVLPEPLSIGTALVLPNPDKEKDLIEQIARCTRQRPPENLKPLLLWRKAIRLLIAEHGEIPLRGIRFVVREQKDIEIVGEATNPSEAVDMTRSLQPDILLLDLKWDTDEMGVAVVQHLHREVPKTKIIALSAYPVLGAQAITAGAASFLDKDIPFTQLIKEIRRVHAL